MCVCGLFCLSFQPKLLLIPAAQTFFEEESILEAKLSGDWKTLFKDNGEEPAYHDFEFSYLDPKGEWMKTPVRLKVRGNYRRQNCGMPPVRLNFKKKQVKGTYLEGLDKVKLVHPCQGNEKYEQYVLNEYLSYKAYQALTDSSFRVRLLKLTYEGEGMTGKKGPKQYWAFMIEPVKMLEERISGEEIEAPSVHPAQVHTELSVMLSLYNYFLGNTDWSLTKLHNVKLFATKPGALYLPIPYDFDWTGLVGPPYAQPNPILGISSVKERLYRGFCYDKEVTARMVDHISSQEEVIREIFSSSNLLDEKYKKKTLDYVDTFFEVFNDEKKRQRMIIGKCREVGG